MGKNGHHPPWGSHRGQVQMILSLGTTRNLIVGSKTYALNSGDVITFGSSTHQVPIQDEVSTGRISLATFMVPRVIYPLPSEGEDLTILDELLSYTLQLSLLDR